ncbi:hypothetical protein PAXINDRAFT_101155 [Paxillus involutus ATCC 200175]|uniref:BTB domain-containing protein n=1 Tax=Paxillus involutus ATCC 200175 TaxID=664439 RepID=A0A0C9TY44_PAXIN|nr:hypothetical protein PAXINDRAFT_101155 [Paxillus involutus ATCC 200175]
MSEISKHERFYMNTVTFLVEDCLFKVPRSPFETESTVFKDMFSLPVGDLQGVEGLDDVKPIRLEGTKKDDFEQLMRVLLHRTNGLSPEFPVNAEQWTSVLKLSTLWGFSRVRQAAISRLDRFTTIPLAEKIALAYEYELESWLLPTMNELVRRPKSITMEEARCMGFETALKLASVREQLALRSVPQEIRHQSCGEAPTSGSRRNGPWAQQTSMYTSNTTVTHCRCPTEELIPGPRADVQKLDFTPLLRTTFNIVAIK